MQLFLLVELKDECFRKGQRLGTALSCKSIEFASVVWSEDDEFCGIDEPQGRFYERRIYRRFRT